MIGVARPYTLERRSAVSNANLVEAGNHAIKNTHGQETVGEIGS